jgi:uncharacterized protein YbjT (DUF2867 family)
VTRVPGRDGRRILLAGGTGYVGGRLLRVLEETGRPLRCLARKPGFLRPRVAASTEVFRGDVLEMSSLSEAMKDVHTAYYLVHSMAAGGGFEERDRLGAENFARAARENGVRRIIYLGGLGGGGKLSSHLASRQEVGEILRGSGVPTIEFRASIIIGSGSLSFEMVRALVEKLPVMITPRWVGSLAQPIAIEDVTAYLSQALELADDDSYVFEIGGADQVSYKGIMREYARQRGLRRLMVPVPVLTPWLSSLWLGLVTPIYSRVGRQLIEGVRNDTVVEDDLAMRVFGLRPRGIEEAIARALSNEEQEFAETRWSDALSSRGPLAAWGGERFGSRIIDSETVAVSQKPAAAFAPIRRIGGETGWYYADWLWRLRGLIDLLFGGAGMRRGRRSQDSLAPGDTVDFWRVEAFEPDRLLRLISEMRLPGRAWLQFEVEGDDSGSVIRQTAMFDPVGLPGLAYWYVLYPIHKAVFKGMLRRVAQAAERGEVT